MLGGISVACICAFMLEPILTTPLVDCDKIPLADRTYNTEEVAKLDGNYVPREMAVSHKTGNIYIMDASPYVRVLKKSQNGIQVINTQVASAYSIAMDNTAGKLYIGCKTRFAIYDEEKDSIEFLHGDIPRFWKIFIPINTSKLYAVSWEKNHVIEYSKDDLTTGVSLNLLIISGYSDRFVIDGFGNYYFNTYNKYGRHVTEVLRKGNTERIAYTKYINNLSVDNKGRVFGTNYYHLYQLESDNPVPQLIKSLGFITQCISFDKCNTMVFSTFDKTIVTVKLNNICNNSSSKGIAPEYDQTVNADDRSLREKWIESRTNYINMIEKNYNDWKKMINETDTKMNITSDV